MIKASGESCYHCGLPVLAGSRYYAFIEGARQPMCCAGCQAVAQAIAGGGLSAYYRSRSAYAARQEADAVRTNLAIYDDPQVQREFVREAGAAREATLLLEGINCAACIWLNEQHLSRLPGVLAVEINYTTHRARVRWDPAVVKLSEILHAVHAIGYRAFPSSGTATEQARRRESRSALWRLFVAGFGTMQVMMYALPTYLADDGTMSADLKRLMWIASFMLTVPVILYSAAPFFRGAWRDLRLRRLGMDVPVALGIVVAFAASVYATMTGTGEVYFDSITMFVFFLLCGRYLEMRARQKAATSLEYLDRALPLAAHRLTSWPRSRHSDEVPSVSLARGDLVLVKPGEVIPADGVLLDGESEIDESLLTGESRTVVRRVGAEVVAGAVNRLSPMVVRVERAGEATRVSHVRQLTERAAGQRPQLVELTDRIAGWFIALVLVVAAGAALAWAGVEPARGLWIAVAVLVVTCPCALSLATPAALGVSVGTLARRGVVATRGHALEALARVTHVVFDKTGTLTEGRLSLRTVDLLGGLGRNEALALAAALEQGSEHPIANAIAAAVQRDSVPTPKAERLTRLGGAGLEATVSGRRVRLGTQAFVAALAGAPTDVAASGSATPVWLGSEQGWLARFAFTDAVRAEAAEVVARLQAEGKRVSILSGDAPETVEAVARQLGIDDFAGNLMPEDKYVRVRALQQGGALVAMVGDGVNDAPVLAQAHLSIAMGSGAILSQAQSDLVLLSGKLGGLIDALRISRRTMAIVRQNLTWAILYNVVALPLAVAGYVTPWMAGIGMGASSLIVVLNALRLVTDEPQASAKRYQARGTRHEARQAYVLGKPARGTDYPARQRDPNPTQAQ